MGKSSLFFIQHYPHPSQVLEIGEIGILKLSKEHNLKLRQTTIQKLLYAANQALSHSLEELSSKILILSMKLQDLERLNKNISDLEREVGRCLYMHNKGLKPFAERLKEKGKHARKVFIALGNKFLKIAFAMIRDKQPFMSKQTDFHVLHEINKKLSYTCLIIPTTEQIN
ncbi:MAG: transposase [Candidatus Petromonas sp.]|nr:transposase [Candidatus Petromonas sp.]